jgi:hypothetical protein
MQSRATCMSTHTLFFLLVLGERAWESEELMFQTEGNRLGWAWESESFGTKSEEVSTDRPLTFASSVVSKFVTDWDLRGSSRVASRHPWNQDISGGVDLIMGRGQQGLPCNPLTCLAATMNRCWWKTRGHLQNSQ